MIRHSLLNRKNWDEIAVIEEDKHFSYRDLLQQAETIKQQLPQGKREKVAIFLPNSASYIAAFFGIIMTGMTAFPLSIQLTQYEIASLLIQASVQTVITSRVHRLMFKDIAKIVSVQAIYIEDMPKLKPVVLQGVSHISADEPMILLTTPGTTGKAKIAQLSERNIASSTFAYINKMSFEKIPENDIRFALGAPFSSAYGLMILTACVIKSFPIIVLKEDFTLNTLYQAAQEHRITHFEGGVSAGLLMEQMAERSIPYDISSFRYFGLAGSRISSNTLRRLMRAYTGIEFWTGYGMTEAGPLIAKPDKKVDMDKLDSVGTKADCSIRINIDGMLTDTPHAKGEIVVKGPNVMGGYYENEEETRKILKDGYLYTGDIGYLDEDGYLYICEWNQKNAIGKAEREVVFFQKTC